MAKYASDEIAETDNEPRRATEDQEGPPIRRGEGCDRCGAQAYHRVTFASGLDLLFCDHHKRQHEDKLKQVALKIDDKSGQMKAEETTDKS